MLVPEDCRERVMITGGVRQMVVKTTVESDVDEPGEKR